MLYLALVLVGGGAFGGWLVWLDRQRGAALDAAADVVSDAAGEVVGAIVEGLLGD